MQGDLTNLDAVRAWLRLPQTSTTMDQDLQALIRAASAFVRSYLDRPNFGKRAVVDVVDGNGRDFMLLRDWPVLSVEGVQWAGQTSISATAGFNPQTDGLRLEAPRSVGAMQRLSLTGYTFPAGRNNVQINYTVGYVVTAEPQTVASGVAATNEFWAADMVVTYANGTALTLVAASPAQGQYAVDADGNYSFNVADNGAAVLISYGYVPADIQQAVTELVGERYKSRERIGVTGQTLAGKESVTFFQTKDLGSFIKSSLQPYKRVI